MNSWMRSICLAGLYLCGLAVPNGDAQAQHFVLPVGHDFEGLPVSGDAMALYGDDPNSLANRLHQILFLEALIPEEIQAELPSERKVSGLTDADFFVPGWYFKKRAGEETDRRVFGGDIRVSPRRTFSQDERNELLHLLRQLTLDPKLPATASEHPSLVQLMLQWDLLSVWWGQERAKSEDSELMEAFSAAILALAQPASTLGSLPSGLEALWSEHAAATPGETSRPYLPQSFLPVDSVDSPWIEVGRKSSSLFKADRSLRASRTYLNAGTRELTLQVLASSGQSAGMPISLPSGTQTLLIQQMIGIDPDFQPVVTPVVDEVRIRVMEGIAELSATNSTSSRDGSSHWIFMRTRYGTARQDVSDFRFVPDSEQALFLEYGTQKHATFAAQCALCHRRTNDGTQAAGGIRMLARHAKPHPATANERIELAQTEMTTVVERLRERIDASKSRTVRIPPRPERSEEERQAWVSELRKLYVPTEPNAWPAPNVDAGVNWKEIGLLPPVNHPDDNPYSLTKAELGKVLFFDPRLSGSGQIACASCHDPDLAWADGRTTSFGHSRTLLTRNAPTIRNSGHFDVLFWDGRVHSLEEQVIQVLENPSEMRSSEVKIVDRLDSSEGYRELFKSAFGNETISFDRIAKAIACFERTVVGGSSRFDAFMRGKPEALRDAELIGLDLYRREARCINCHHGSMFSDGQFHDVGLSYYGRRFEDLGRFELTGEAADVGRFRTPSLRDITRTQPLMHNGLFELPGVLNMYNAGMPTLKRKDEQADDPHFPTKSPLLRPLGLNKQDLSDLQAFLATLEEPKRRIWPPAMPLISEP